MVRFYKCNTCGQIITKIKNTEVEVFCCGEPMQEIVPMTHEEGLTEKHVPVFKLHKNKVIVEIGEVRHPSTEQHYIEWILLETNKGCQRKELKPGDTPCVEFTLCDDEEIKTIYAYCNIHSLWKTRNLENNDFKKCGCKKGLS